MALIHRATLAPSKLELVSSWLPTRAWYERAVPDLRSVGAYRFDDPAGEVGIEALLLQGTESPVYHVPLTYRSAPLPGAERHLLGTGEHSVLGTRWVYDGCGDPVWASELAAAILGGGSGAEELVDVDGRLQPRTSSATVRGSGSRGTPGPVVDLVTAHDEGTTTVIHASGIELVVVRVVGTEVWAAATLAGEWGGGGPAVLAGLVTRDA